MSLTTSTISGRKLTAVGVCVLAGLAAGFAFALAYGGGAPLAAGAGHDEPAVAAPADTDADGLEAATPAPPDVDQAAAAAEAPASAPVAEDGAVVPSQPAPPDADVADAGQVAADFAVAYATYSWDETPEQARARLQPLVTAELDAELARNSGAAAGSAELAERRQWAIAVAETVQLDSVGEGYLDLLVVVRQDVSWDGGEDSRWPSYLLRVVQDDAGWTVSGLLP
jgi:hypothetical protein